MLALLSLLLVPACLGLHDSVIESVGNDFTGFAVYRAAAAGEEEAAYLQQLRQSNFYDFWTEVRVGGQVDIMAPPNRSESQSTNLVYKITNLQEGSARG